MEQARPRSVSRTVQRKTLEGCLDSGRWKKDPTPGRRNERALEGPAPGSPRRRTFGSSPEGTTGPGTSDGESLGEGGGDGVLGKLGRVPKITVETRLVWVWWHGSTEAPGRDRGL